MKPQEPLIPKVFLLFFAGPSWSPVYLFAPCNLCRRCIQILHKLAKAGDLYPLVISVDMLEVFSAINSSNVIRLRSEEHTSELQSHSDLHLSLHDALPISDTPQTCQSRRSVSARHFRGYA